MIHSIQRCSLFQCVALLFVAAAFALSPKLVAAGFLTVHAAPAATNYSSIAGVSDNGLAVAAVDGQTVWWNASANGIAEGLDNPEWVTSQGWTVGRTGTHGVLWDPGTNMSVQPDNLGSNFFGESITGIGDINRFGVMVGSSDKFVIDNVTGEPRGFGARAVRWDPQTLAATELGNLDESDEGVAYTLATAINSSGDIVGRGHEFSADPNLRGLSPIYWHRDTLAAIELPALPSPPGFRADSMPTSINDAGSIIGITHMEIVETGATAELRATRWSADTHAVEELGHLGLSAEGTTQSIVWEINADGDSVGVATKYNDEGRSLGQRAVRWNADSTEPIELVKHHPEALRIDTEAADINNAGVVVGHEVLLFESFLEESNAVLWLKDGRQFDLNDLIDPDSGWDLHTALRISDTGWIVGRGTFDDDGLPETEPLYGHPFLIHVPMSAVPEPSSAMLLGLGGFSCFVATVTRFLRRNRG